MNLLYFIAAILLVFHLPLMAQDEDNNQREGKTRIQLVIADEMNFDKERLGPDVIRLKGNVIFEHDSMYMYCDSAYLYEKQNSMKAWGNIHIEASDTLSIYGDKLVYAGDEQIAELRKNVKLVDNHMTLTTDHLDYNLSENFGQYVGGGKIVDTTNRLTSQIGYYYADDKNFFFKDSVILTNPDYTMDSDTLLYNTSTEIAYFHGPSYIRSDSNLIYCENGWYDTRNDISQFNENASLSNNRNSLQGDSIYYDRNLGLGKAFQNVTVIDSIENIVIMGHTGLFWEKTNNSLMTDSAQAVQIDEGDSLFMHADTLKYIGDTTRPQGKQLFAYYKVKLYRINLQGKCDSMVYQVADSVIKLYHEPVLWSGQNQLYSDSIWMYTAKSKVKKMFLYHNAFMAEMDLDSIHFNQIKGKIMIGYFNQRELHKVEVQGNAETVYSVRNDQEKLIGINLAASSDLTIYLKDKRIERLTFINQVSAKLFPPKEITKEKSIINNFQWFEEERPQNRYEIFY
ncbi:MAG: OstA-like protein [Bacteroidales bacterium]